MEDEHPREESANDIDICELSVLEESHEMLVWSTSPVRYKGLCRIRTPYSKDGIYHAILNGCSEFYRRKSINGFQVTCDKQVSMFRQELAHNLGSGRPGERPYDQLNKGTASAIASQSPEYSLRTMQRSLLVDGSIATHLMPFVCGMLGIDIIYISGLDRDVETMSMQAEQSIRRRPTVLLVYSRNHYELVGIMREDGDIDTCFHQDHPYIKLLRQRIGVDETP